MRREPLPDFATPSTRQLRELWRKYPDDEAVRSACLEIERMRQVFVEIEAYRVVVARCWREETRSTLVGLEKLRMLMEAERSRLGSVATRSRQLTRMRGNGIPKPRSGLWVAVSSSYSFPHCTDPRVAQRPKLDKRIG